jgi:hypothetical protein
MANPFVGLGTVVNFGTVANTYTLLAGVETVSFSGDKVATNKTTTMLSTGGVDTFIPGTQNPGTLDIKAFLLPGDASQLAFDVIRANASPIAAYFQVQYAANAHSKTFQGVIESATPNFPMDKPATIDYKVQISGPVVTL